MKKFKTGTSFHMESEDGSCHTVSIASVKVSKTGEVQVVGQFTDPASVRYVNEPIDFKDLKRYDETKFLILCLICVYNF
jgi:YbbR domain-containing protein